MEADTFIALHLATGDAALARAADEALARHGARWQRFSDVYAAAVFVLRNKARAAALVVVGLDGLAADEVRIVEYIRATWGEVALIVYAAHAVPSGTVAGAPVRATTAQLVAAIDEFYAAAANESGDPAATGRSAGSEPANRGGRGFAAHSNGGAGSQEGIASQIEALDARPDGRPDVGLDAGIRHERSILTTEELAALLGGFEP